MGVPPQLYPPRRGRDRNLIPRVEPRGLHVTPRYTDLYCGFPLPLGTELHRHGALTPIQMPMTTPTVNTNTVVNTAFHCSIIDMGIAPTFPSSR